jgi:hypothetical protein
MNSHFCSCERIFRLVVAASLIGAMFVGCGRPESSPPVPKTVTGYKALLGGRTFYAGGNAWTEPERAARMQFRTDGVCAITDAPELLRTGAMYLAFKAAFHDGGEGLWSIEQDGIRFLLVIKKSDGAPWAHGVIFYRQDRELPPHEKFAVRLDVRWEVATQPDGVSPENATRTVWHSIARDPSSK